MTFSEATFVACAASGADSFWRFAEKACRLAGVDGSIAKQEPQAKLEAVVRGYGLTFKGKPITTAGVLALKDCVCGSAFGPKCTQRRQVRQRVASLGGCPRAVVPRGVHH